ncbi:MAG: hypothetical protein M3N41_07185 [Acidobacteriota bacterium]|nr:hypothetical protein [Acidobacteriota bacterium]
MQASFLKCIFVCAGAAALAVAQQKPDLSGVWTAKNERGARYRSWSFMAEEPPMTPWALEKFKLTKPSFGPRSFKDSNDPVNPTTVNSTGCFPPGVPRIYLQPFPMEIVQQPNRVLMIYEFDHLIRQIWMDGRAHVKDLPGTWMGDSIGKWEGDTLVVDTTGFNDKTWLDRAGHPHSEDLHVVERLKRTDAKTLQIDITMDDPMAYTKPWGGQLLYTQRPDWNISELICVDNANFDQFLKNEEGPAK